MTDQEIIEKYRDVFSKYARDGIVDLDKRLRHKFAYQVYRLEHVIKELGGNVPPNRQSLYYITLIQKGSGEKTVGHFTFPIIKNTLLIIPKRVIHSSKYWSLNCSGYVIMFNVDFFLNNAFPRQLILNKKVFKNSTKPFLVLSGPQEKKMKVIFEHIIAEHEAQQPAKSEMIAIRILELLIQCDRFFTEAEALGKEIIYNPLTERFNNLVEQHFTSQRSVSFYAGALHVHPNHLNFISKKTNGLSAKQVIDKRILQEAQYLLKSSYLPVKETAHRLGFENTGYFSSFFRKGAGVSPMQYRDSVV